MLRWYLREVRKKLIFAGKEKKRFLNDLRENVNLYLEEHPNAEKGDLLERFGSPQELSESFYRDAEIDEKVLLQRRRFFRAILITVVALGIILAGLAVLYVSDVHDFTHGDYEKSTQCGAFDITADSSVNSLDSMEVY